MEARAPQKCRRKGCKLYPCDLSRVPKILCVTCSKPIGNKPYVENRTTVRFGTVTLNHAECAPRKTEVRPAVKPKRRPQMAGAASQTDM